VSRSVAILVSEELVIGLNFSFWGLGRVVKQARDSAQFRIK
jgi:hypothetical protein